MSAASVLTVVGVLVGLIALLLSLHTRRRLVETQAELASASAALTQERESTAKSIAAAQEATVDEVSALLDNLLAHIDTEVAGKVAEALALLRPG